MGGGCCSGRGWGPGPRGAEPAQGPGMGMRMGMGMGMRMGTGGGAGGWLLVPAPAGNSACRIYGKTSDGGAGRPRRSVGPNWTEP